MYAIVEEGGKQYLVEKGDTLYIERRADLKEGAKTVEMSRVLMLGRGAECKIGTPCVEGAKVVAQVLGEVKGPKLEIVKFRRRKGYKLHKGHRQKLLKVTVDKITG